MIFRKGQVHFEEQENSFWISYSDILSSLLIIILLITVYVIFELMQTKKNVTENLVEITKAEMVRQETLADIQEALKREGIVVEIADNFSVLRIPESTLTFNSNEFDITKNYTLALKKIGEVIIEVLLKEDRKDFFDTIFVEGHTDIRPSRREMGNLGLSTFRAISVWNYWISNVTEEYQKIENLKGDKLFSVSGYGSSRPAIEKQVTEEDFRKNRRIDIRFTIRKPTSVEFNDLMKLFQ